MLKYKRIMVIGCPGSGKSTFSRRLGEISGISVTHLDNLFWNPGWVEEDREIFREKQQEIINKESWIIDGHYKSTMAMRLERAELVFWYRLSRYECIIGYLRRLVRGIVKKGSRPDITDGCNEKIDLEFIRYIWNFNKAQVNLTEELLKRYPNVKVVAFNSRKQADRFLDRL